jgi:hypothetical protein
MNLSEKIGYAQRHVESIARHDDEDAAVRKAALRRLRDLCDAEEAAIDARIAEKVGAL